MGKAKVVLNSVTTVGLDLAKHVFHLHAVDEYADAIRAGRYGRSTMKPYSCVTKCVNFWCLNARNSSRRCATIWRRLGLLQLRGRMEPPHWLQRSWRATVPSRFAYGTPSRRLSVSFKRSTMRSPRTTAPSWSWRRTDRAARC